MEAPQSADITWRDLPKPLIAHILRLTLQSSGRTLLQWLRLHLVCRDWQKIIQKEAVDIVVPRPTTAEQNNMQRRWLDRTRVPVRRITFEPAVGGPEALSVRLWQFTAARLAIARLPLTASLDTLEEIHNLYVPASRPAIMLARFASLRRLSLLNADQLPTCSVVCLIVMQLPRRHDCYLTAVNAIEQYIIDELTLESLPPSLESLQLALETTVKGRTFACLPHLRELRVEAKPKQPTGAICAWTPDREATVISADLNGFPIELQTLEVTLADTNANAVLEVKLPIGPPATSLRVEACSMALEMPPCYKCIHVENTNGRAYGPPVTARRMELSAGVISLPRHSDIMEQLQLQLQHDLITDAGKQLFLGACLVNFLTMCGTVEVLLDLKQIHEFSTLVKLKVVEMGAQGGRPQVCQATYSLGSRDLLDAVSSPCQQHGIRCTDVTETGQLFLFEHV